MPSDSSKIPLYSTFWMKICRKNIMKLLLFRFIGGDGEETKQCTLDVLHTDRGLPLGML
jgi:hypothetical protein